MASGVTNRGRFFLGNLAFRNATEPTNFYIALCTSATTPTVDINTLSQLTQIQTGNGYSDGGYQLARDSTDCDTATEDDTNDMAFFQWKDVVWTASGGTIPASGSGARWAVLTDDNATVGSREVYAWFDLVSDRTVSDGQTLTLQNLEFRLTTPA